MGFSNSITYDANNYMDAAFAPAQLAYSMIIQKETWGHLAPVKNRIYRGCIVFSISAYGDMVILDSNWGKLPDSPWLFDAMHDFVFEDDKLVHGAIYRFDGTLRNYKFNGTRTVLYAPKPEAV